MKNKNQIRQTIILYLLAILLISCENNHHKITHSSKTKNDSIETQQNDKIFKSLDKKEILTRLYDNPIIDTNGIAIWKPNYEESMNYHVSYDGKCHTALDTIMYFVNNRGSKCAVVILATYFYCRNYLDTNRIEPGGDCHFCGVPIGMALLSQYPDGSWELYGFEKNFAELGYFGEYKTGREDAGKICLKEIGDKWTCLSLKQGVGGNSGYLWGYEMLFNIEKFYMNTQESTDELHEGWPIEKSILCYNYLYSDDNINSEAITEMRIIKKQKNYYGIDLVKTKDGKKTIKHFTFSEVDFKFIER